MHSDRTTKRRRQQSPIASGKLFIQPRHSLSFDFCFVKIKYFNQLNKTFLIGVSPISGLIQDFSLGGSQLQGVGLDLLILLDCFSFFSPSSRHSR